MDIQEKMKTAADAIALKLFNRDPNDMPTKEDMKFFNSWLKINGGKAGNAGKRKPEGNKKQKIS